LFIPSQDSFIKVEAIPILGTGKLDLRGLQQMAKDLAK
jgi:acyl-[acyl-carrier-protein]-phospholipid O-acyltransferase/long-chain-fatty-acid--[acyl-carrier-protein] ligase